MLIVTPSKEANKKKGISFLLIESDGLRNNINNDAKKKRRKASKKTGVIKSVHFMMGAVAPQIMDAMANAIKALLLLEFLNKDIGQLLKFYRLLISGF